MPVRVLLVSPSRDRGGGIERYVATIERVLCDEGIECDRIDLSHAGVFGHIRLIRQCHGYLRSARQPVRLIVAHRALLPAVALAGWGSDETRISVLNHGIEVWSTSARLRTWLERRIVRGPRIRNIAVSSFTSGAMLRDVTAAVLRPALPADWFGTLVAAGHEELRRPRSAAVRLVTAFRLGYWREKGLPALLTAIESLGRDDISLTICGSGSVPDDLELLIRDRPWCQVRANLPDTSLAEELAGADLFVLASRTRHGPEAAGEGFGIVLLEAQVAGTPVIAPAYGGASDAFLEGITGLSPTDESSAALGALLTELLREPARLAEMGAAAAAWSRRQFAPASYAKLAVRRLL